MTTGQYHLNPDKLQEDVLSEHIPWLRRLILSRTGGTQFVDDVLQEIGCAVSRSESIPQDDMSLRKWLCTIAIRQCALAIRKHQRNQSLQERVVANGHVAASVSVDDDPIFWLLHCESKELIREAISELDSEMRALLIQKFVEGKSYRQLAEQLGVMPHVVEYRVTTAKKQLRRLLVDRGLGKEDLP